MHKNEIVVKSAKIAGTSKEDVTASLLKAYPGFIVANVLDENKEWKAVLTKELSDKEVSKLSAFPPEEEDTSSSEEPKTESKPKAESSGEKPEGESEGGEELGEMDPKSELKDILGLLSELTTQVKELHDQHQEVKDALQNIHDTSKPHVEGPEDLGPKDPGELGPTAPGGGNPLGLGKGPKPPLPGAGRGQAPRGPRPVPPVGNVKTAFAAVSHNGVSFAMADVVEAMHAKYPGFEVKNISKDVARNRFVAKLEPLQ